jgi:hypothetical protein
VSITIFNRTLTGSFVASQSIVVVNNAVSLNFTLTVTNGPATIEWYLELGSDEATPTNSEWFRELAEEDPGNGAVALPIVVRTFAANGGGGLADGTYRLDAELVRRAKMARVQIRATAGTVQATVTAPFGLVAQAAS